MNNNCRTQLVRRTDFQTVSILKSIRDRWHPFATLAVGRAASLLGAILIAFASVHIRAETVILNPIADTDIEQFSPSVNFGASATAVSGALGTAASHEIRRMLLRFNFTGKIPAGAVVSSVTLRVQVTRVPQQPANSTFGLRPLLQSWIETAVTWNSRFSGTPWQTPGASGAADSAAAPSSTVFVAGFGSYVFPSTPALVADVQGWLNNSSANFGWLLVSTDENSLRTARHFGTRESSSAPVLTVTYTVPPLAISQQPQSRTVLEGTSVQFAVVASGAPPIRYQWQFYNTDIPGATNTTFNLASAQLTNAGSYTVIVSNSTESVTSVPAILTVNPIVLPVPTVTFLEPTNGARGTIQCHGECRGGCEREQQRYQQSGFSARHQPGRNGDECAIQRRPEQP